MEYVKLRNYIELISGRDLTKAQYNDKNKGIPYIMGASNMTNGKLNIERWTNEPTVIGEKGDLIISVKGTVGELLILEEEKVHLSRQVMAIRPKEGYDVKFVFYYMKYYLDRLKEKAKGMIPGVTREDILDAEFIEVSSEEQQRIIKILDKAQELIDKRKEQIEALDELVKSRFIEMFGDPINNPMGWDVKKLKNISTKILSGNTPKGGSEVYVDEGIMFFRSQNVWKNKLVLDDIAYIDKETHNKMLKSSLKNRDILMTKTGRINTENSSLGRAAMFVGEDNSANINGHVYLIRLQEGEINEFVLFILTTNEYRDYIRSVCVGGIDKRQINKEHLEEFPIIYPPIELQNQFAAFVNQVDKLKFAMESSLKELENNFNSLMQKAFKGELFN
ncbi:restriction endonuclease subunit S [Clostridium sp. SYSU_GA19001]|uniref:restriction endonuclease subunit S n=1 Tax=Clostridium caldaquaticum TaxID=2940653 RepID=UPI0020771774|nr:restriction endonuclease subunit S [Clostridium caldaquaticum]MCM8712101.1 restriction endonuclease subunit S [Clostridium caldaquaticum]